ncbi:hypothetical protein ACYPKM_01900 [Pseudomonas aeruginosa]
MNNNARILSRQNIRETHPARLELNDYTLSIAKNAIRDLWKERLDGLGRFDEGHRDGSQKFAALLARRLFGGKLAGNENHVFVELPCGKVLDLNDDQPGVKSLGDAAYRREDLTLLQQDYRVSLASCVGRVERWAERATSACPEKMVIPLSPQHKLDYDLS